ncbi:MAG: hypothetical protein AAGA48_24880 [Myxococcota bacterium]
MRSLLISAGALGLIMALGCGGLVPNLADLEPEVPPSANWVGDWSWQDGESSARLVIEANGNLQYESQGPNSNSSFAGPAMGWEKELSCCLGLSTWTIDTPPVEGEDGSWTMTLDGRTFVRGPRGPDSEADEIERLLEAREDGDTE